MTPKSITEIKAAFLLSQIRLLSTALQPSASWRDLAPELEDGNLSDKTVQDIVAKVNDKIKQHNRMVFSAQSQRHVAEQIEQLHWNNVTAMENQADLAAVIVKRDADLNTTDAIESLPDNPEDLLLQPDQIMDRSEGPKYRELQKQLTELIKVRDDKMRKLEQYQQLQAYLKPFDDPQANIQPNLVTKGGDLSKELEKMRILLARVTDKVADMKTVSVTSKPTNQPSGNSQKMQNILKLM